MSGQQFTAADKASIDAYPFFMQVGISACLTDILLSLITT